MTKHDDLHWHHPTDCSEDGCGWCDIHTPRKDRISPAEVLVSLINQGTNGFAFIEESGNGLDRTRHRVVVDAPEGSFLVVVVRSVGEWRG